MDVMAGELDEMEMNNQIDITFNMYSDTPSGKDPDARSPTLRSYHKRLWSKPLPHGKVFELVDSVPKSYLHHKSELGEFSLASDAITHSYKNTKSMQHILCELAPSEIDELFSSGSTIGSYLIFPGKQINGKITINAARGINHRIKDRFDLSLECIRRHYVGEPNPLSDTLQRYGSFFDLFVDFKQYVEFFLLHDLVAVDFSTIKYYLPFDDFEGNPLPNSVNEYRTYRTKTLEFIKSRNQRILDAVSAIGAG
jgi:hypothetical protein